MRFPNGAVLLLIATIAFAVRGDANLSPYASDPEHLWNRLHRAFFVHTVGGVEYSHSTDPHLYRNGTYLLEGPSHQRALDVLDEFARTPPDAEVNTPLKRLLLQHDLWAVFDYAAGGDADEGWERPARLLPAARALRERAAKAIERLLLSDGDADQLADNYATAVKSHQFAGDDDPAHPDQAFLPADLFDATGPWVRFHNAADPAPMGRVHFRECGGRAVHLIFLRLPGGRAATERYLRGLNDGSSELFPPGTMVAIVRQPLVVTRSRELRVAPITEVVQIRVYRRVRAAGEETRGPGLLPGQSVHEFLLDRPEFLAGRSGLRELTAATAFDLFPRAETPMEQVLEQPMHEFPAVAMCVSCHSQRGLRSVVSIDEGFAASSPWQNPPSRSSSAGDG